MTPSLLYRSAAVLLLLYAVGHTMGSTVITLCLVIAAWLSGRA